MTRIRDWFATMRSKRSHLIVNESVSFDAFTNEVPPGSPPGLRIRESSLINQIHRPKEETYERFSENPTGTKCTRPSCVSVILFILLTFVFLILPVIYLLHCFDLLHSHWKQNLASEAHIHVNGETHYFPGSRVHDLLNDFVPLKQHAPKIKNITLTDPPKPTAEQCNNFQLEDRFDCYPEPGASQAGCESRGCCWAPVKHSLNYPKTYLNVPYCFYPRSYGGYKVLNISKTAYGLTAYMQRTFKSAYPDDIKILKMIVKFEEENRLHVKLIDPENTRYETPYPEVPIIDGACRQTSYSFVMDHTKAGFKVVRKSDGTVIFDAMDMGGFIYADQFLQMSARLPSKHIYGLGEHQGQFLLSTNWNRMTLFNLDQMPVENLNLYGSHPMYLNIEPSGKANGVFLLNSNAMDIILQDSPAITFRTIGGVLDFYFFTGPSPAEVIQQYTAVIGRPSMPPFWGLGFHLCRYGYKSTERTKEIWKRNIDAGIPLDVQWNDIDYMHENNDFTRDKVNFKDLPEFVKEVHSMGMHYVPILDPGVSGSETPGTYPAYDKGLEMKIFVMNSSSQPFIGKVWNTKSTVWPDFTNPSTVYYWTEMIQALHDDFEFDGLWIDMNEPSNFLSGSTTGCPQSKLEDPPYVPGVNGGKLNFKTMCMTAQHYAGLHYNLHNLYGLTEAMVTNFALAEIRGKRPFIISRSTFPGLGRYAGHWSGDVLSAWKDMALTIPDLLTFSLYGIPLMGSDICGFNGNTTAALCQRWMQLGAFYPFSRNHNTDNGIDQDPVAFGQEVIDSSRTALQIRYSLLPYLYTLFWKAHTNGDTVARPLFFEFTNDTTTYGIDDQFLWGPAFMICPVLKENQTTLSPYLPPGRWYEFYTLHVIESKGERINISAPLDTIPLYIRGGFVLPMQKPAESTYLMRNSTIRLLAAPDIEGNGVGELYWDDGDSLNSVEELKNTVISFSLKSFELRSTVTWLGEEKPPNLGRVIVLGLPNQIRKVTVNEKNVPYKYDSTAKFLTVENLNVSLTVPFVIQWE